MSKLVIKQATFEDMDFFLSQATEEGWNPGLCDALPFYSTDPNGFFIGYLDAKKVGCISAVAYNTRFGFIGFYIVLPLYRGKGMGHQLWAHGLNYLGDRVIGLDGVLAQQQSYEQSHFQLYYKNHRFVGKCNIEFSSPHVVDLKEISFEQLLNYDISVFGLRRAIFLKHWIEMPNTYSLAKVLDGQLVGYGVLRSCKNGYKVGPLFADDVEVATEIFQCFCTRVKEAPIFLDIPAINPQAMQMAKTFHLDSVFETVRMYNKKPPIQQMNKIFGVTSFELG